MTAWSRETVDPAARKWEEFYRNRFQHDKRVRTTHGVNCTGSCSWEVFVKDGIVTWELQATDYPQLEEGLPPYEPRGCQRGISYSWYLYSPIRVKYPYARGVLIDLYRRAKADNGGDPVRAWASIQANPKLRSRYQKSRGKGGFRRISWDEALEISAASTVHTIVDHGPDRVAGFSPIPAMSQVSYAAGSRFMSLIGGVVMSFYDWYCDLPPASPEIWGEQTDVHESADWYNSRFIAVMGSNLNMTRTPDTHFISEVRHAGAKLSVFSPDFSQVAKYADWWIPCHPGQDTAYWLAVNHVLLTEYYRDRRVEYFENYARQYTDLPFLVEIRDGQPGKYLRADRLERYHDTENGAWKLLMWDDRAGEARMPNGSIGDRWATGDEEGRWNLELFDSVVGAEITPALSFVDDHDAVAPIELEYFGGDGTATRSVPVRTIETIDGPVTVTTVFDLLNARFGVDRGLDEDRVTYDDDAPYTPAWQEKHTGIHRDTLVSFAREWGRNGELTRGKNLIIIGAGANHWYHNNLLYRSGITALMLTGSVGVNGGGLAHYVGQEKLVSAMSWGAIAFAQDWGMAPRQQNTPSFHYVHSDQWRYERGYRDYEALPAAHPERHDHTIDHQARAVRNGWLPFFPQFKENPIDVVRTARRAGAADPAAVSDHIAGRLVSGDLELSIDDPDAPENWPRTWFIWRGNAIGTSAKGHEFFLRHYLGTDSTAIAAEPADHGVSEVMVRPDAPIGKMDLVVDLNFRMDTSALYSDIVLPAATWYEKDDLNTTDLHSFINPMQAAVAPAWESKSDWDIFKALAAKVSELAVGRLDGQIDDVVMQPLAHDSPDEISQPNATDWRGGEVDAVPGRSMPKFSVVSRDYTNLYEHMVSLGEGVRKNGVAAHGLRIPVADFYDELARRQPDESSRDNGQGPLRPTLERARDVCEAILALDPASNGELAHRAFEAEEAKTGRPLAHLGAGQRDTRIDFAAIVAQPRRVMTTPTWSGLVGKGRAYSPYTLNVEGLVPWRTLTGRQHFYLDHDRYLEWGEHLPAYKPRPDHAMLSELEESLAEGQQGKLFNYITPHGKWSIHSTYSESERMMTLSRGGYPVWVNAKDAAELGIADNDWVELYNDNGVFVQRCTTSSRIPQGTVFVYHATERTVGIPISPLRKKRAGMNNSLTRTRLKPVLMSGGYAQFTYGFNYWGPTGVNRDTFVYLRRIDRPDYREDGS